MPIKIKLGQLAAAVEAKAIERLETCEAPMRHRFAAAKLCAAVLEEYRRYGLLRDDLVRKHGIEDKEKRIIIVTHPDNPPERVRAFHDCMNELLSTEVDLTSEPLSIAQLGEKCTLGIGDIRMLGPLLVE